MWQLKQSMSGEWNFRTSNAKLRGIRRRDILRIGSGDTGRVEEKRQHRLGDTPAKASSETTAASDSGSATRGPRGCGLKLMRTVPDKPGFPFALDVAACAPSAVTA